MAQILKNHGFNCSHTTSIKLYIRVYKYILKFLSQNPLSLFSKKMEKILFLKVVNYRIKLKKNQSNSKQIIQKLSSEQIYKKLKKNWFKHYIQIQCLNMEKTLLHIYLNINKLFQVLTKCLVHYTKVYSGISMVNIGLTFFDPLLLSHFYLWVFHQYFP